MSEHAESSSAVSGDEIERKKARLRQAMDMTGIRYCNHITQWTSNIGMFGGPVTLSIMYW